jgi:hypothetical protein
MVVDEAAKYRISIFLAGSLANGVDRQQRLFGLIVFGLSHRAGFQCALQINHLLTDRYAAKIYVFIALIPASPEHAY